MPFTNQTEEKQIERAVLVGLSCPSFNTDQDADERTMDELRALAETAGAEAVAMTAAAAAGAGCPHVYR